MSKNSICWADIPAVNLKRAVAFYAAVLDQPVEERSMDGFDFALLPNAEEGVSASMSVNPHNPPSKTGPMIYLNVEGRLDAAIDAVARHGGEVLQGKHQIGPWGYAAVVVDSEGNRIGLHSPTA